MTNPSPISGTRIRGRFALFLIAGVTLEAGNCGGAGQTVRPDDMSAEQHRAEAQREETAAAAHQAQWNPKAAMPSPFRDPIDHGGEHVFSSLEYNPTDWQLAEAEKHKAHAKQHEAAAANLEHFEQAECKEFSASTRASCPLLGPAEDIRDIDGGVVIRFATSVRVDAVVAHMKCHLAYARVQGFPGASTCPLYLPGLRVRLGAAPSTVEITIGEQGRVEELRRSAHEEVAIERHHHSG